MLQSLIANGIIAAAKNMNIQVPIVVRLQGNNAIEMKIGLVLRAFWFHVVER